jgi:hypothetical protein
MLCCRSRRLFRLSGRIREPLLHGAASMVREEAFDVVFIPGARSAPVPDNRCPQAACAHALMAGNFRIDRMSSTNEHFRKVVNATGYVTFAGMKPDVRE